ncbi:hypothetical protein HHO41_21630 [Bacillus sp. DNRA2]|uniref:tetratricopeptide repeat protein n=1 Tax=Bacillus sp. DNRA2 TaxID=2723053 RepID=UPI00145F62E8|nr:hypothetical protein [Bacillus sp. DNRA2]NMD72826.1 hypothetical protein [Bacillus sp. DNRA2]
MNFRDMSFQELEDYETELNDKIDDSEYSLLPHIIAVLEEMYKRMQRNVREKNGDINHLNALKDQLLYNLINYGTFLKMKDQKDPRATEHTLKEALRYDPSNPIAAYRLGFLAYKDQRFTIAQSHFEKALTTQQIYRDKRYLLNEQQLLNAHLYLTNSALYIAKQTYEKISQLPAQGKAELPNYEFSSLFLSLANFEEYLKQNAFYKITQDSKTTCSKAECERIIDEGPTDTILLYLNDRNIKLDYNGNPETLSQELADILRHLLIYTSENKPATRLSLQKYFPNAHHDGLIKKAAFRKKFSRLYEKLENCEIPPIIHAARNEEPSYYFDRSLRFIIMYRVDEEMEYRF